MTRWKTPRAFVLLAACSGAATDPDASVNPDARPSADASPTDELALAGYVRVHEQRQRFDDPPTEFRSSAVQAVFVAEQLTSFHVEAAHSGDCALHEYKPAFCDPACEEGLCLEGNVCVAYPSYVSAGTLAVTGLSANLTVEPNPIGGYYPSEVLPEDLFAAGATVTAALAGDVIDTFALSAVAPTTIDPEFAGRGITLTPGQDYTLRWTPDGTASDRVRVVLNANNAGHGAPYEAIIECDVEDAAGEVVIGADLIDAFPATQAWEFCAGSDCPPSRLVRYRRARHVLDATRAIELEVASVFLFGVDHEPQN